MITEPKNKQEKSIYKPNDLSGFIGSKKTKGSPKKTKTIKTKYNKNQLWNDVRESFYNLALHKNTNKFQEETNNFCNKYFSNLGVKA